MPRLADHIGQRRPRLGLSPYWAVAPATRTDHVGTAGQGKSYGAGQLRSHGMAPRLHRPIRHDQEEDQDHGPIRCDGRPVPAWPTHGDESEIPVRYANEVELALLFDLYGVNDLAAVEGTDERTVQLSPASDIGCPAHLLTLKPDACRSCRFLAGET